MTISHIALAGFLQTVFFTILIGSKKRKQNKDYFLILFIILIGTELLYRYLKGIPTIDESKGIILFDILYWTLFGPALLLYVEFTISKKRKLKYIDLLHFTPTIIGLIAISEFLFSSEQQVSFGYYYMNAKGLTKYTLLLWEYTTPVYLLFILIRLKKHHKSIKNYFSSLAKKDLKWLFYLTLGFAIFIYSSQLFEILNSIFQFNLSLSTLSYSIVILTIYVFGIGFYGHKQEGIFSELKPLILNKSLLDISENQTKIKYSKSSLSADEKEKTENELIELLKSEKPFLDCELTINDLSEKLDTTIHKLSQIINETYNQNFYEFINSYRIEEAEKYLSNSKYADYKIMAIAYDCGFNSKSAFYSAFKKSTNITPTEYRKKFKSVNEELSIN